MRSWFGEIAMLAALVAGALILGWILGGVAWFLVLALAVFIARWARHLHEMQRWLQSRRRYPPQARGVWGGVFDEYYRLRRRHVRNKRRLAAVIREFREATAAMPDGALVLDGDFRIIWCNDSACRLVRLTDRRDLGQHVSNLIRNPRFVAYLERGDFEQSIEIRSPVDDSRRLMLRLVPYGHDQYLLLIRDVTRLHRLQAMRRDFVANASHELRSPLTVLGGYLDTLAGDPGLGTEWRKPLAEMQAQCRRMNNLVNDLLELSRLETEEVDAPEVQAVDAPALVRTICRDAALADDNRHPIRVEIECEDKLLGVERELHSAFANLVNNALSYSEAGSPVNVTWRKDRAGGAVFEVVDHGIVIDPRHRPFITQRFYRVDSARSRRKGGTGLGLAIVKHVLKRHNADLEVESELGKGSVFRCVFPTSRLAAGSRRRLTSGS
ncbi:MAG: phosphate regulon sensor histidine kinase PhoR [Wenzhouxiangella sp.]